MRLAFALRIIAGTIAFISPTVSQPATAATTGFFAAANRIDMVYSLSRDILYISDGDSIDRYKVSSGVALTPIYVGGQTLGIDISPDESTLAVANSATAGAGPAFFLVNLASSTVSQVVFDRADGEAGSYSVAFGNDGAVLVSTNYNGSGWVPLRRYDPATQTTTIVSNMVDQATMLCASADRSVIAAAEPNSSDGPFGRYRVADGDWQQQSGYQFGTSWFNYEIGVNAHGTQYALPTYGGTFFYGPDLLGVGQTIGTYAGGQPIGIVYSPNSNIVYFPWAGTSTVYAYDTTTFRQIAQYDFGYTFTTNGNWAFNDGRMKTSRDGLILFGTVSGGVHYQRLPTPVPSISIISPGTSLTNTAVRLSLTGTGFVSSSKVDFGGTALTPVLNANGSLSVNVPASLVATAGSVPVTVVNSAPGGGASNTVTLSVASTNPAPTISTISPTSAIAGDSPFPIIVTGANFVANSHIVFGSSVLTTKLNTDNSLTATVPANLIANGATVLVTITSPLPGGGTADSLPFSITNPAPALTALSTSYICAGAPPVHLTAYGYGFVANSTINVNGTALTTKQNADRTLTTTLLSSFFPTRGTLQISVTSYAPGGGTSTALPITILPKLHTFASGLSMVSAPIDGIGFTLPNLIDQPATILASWNPITLQYAVTPDSPAESFHKGMGYWARIPATANLMDTATSIMSNVPFTEYLPVGWNMVGNPRTTPVTVSTIQLEDQASKLHSFVEAANLGLTNNTIFTYGPGDTQYEGLPVDTAIIEPYAAYWIYVTTACTITFPAVQ